MYRNMVAHLVAVVTALLLCCDVAPAVSCTWLRRNIEGPPARHSPGIAYDSRRGVTVLFGGITGRRAGEVLFGDTWEWDGNAWELVATTGPTPRLGHLMVYDEARGVVVLFGGNDGTFRNETWEWDGREWKLTAQTGPSARSRFGMAYDKKRSVVVLFGGIPRDTNDTWEWDGSAWRLVDTGSGPIGRSRVAMVYDEGQETVLLFGGRLVDGQPTGDTWEWDGTTWKQITGTGSHARARHSMVYEPTLGTMVSAGVAFGGGPETLFLNEFQWEEVLSSSEAGRAKNAGPTRRVYYGMVYDAARNATLLYGGWDGNKPLNDTWELKCK
jgi:hypothetical protein